MPAPRPGSLDLIRQGLSAAVASGQLDQPTADGYAATAARAVTELPTIPPLRAQTLSAMLADIAGQASSYTPQYALTLFSMLEFNAQELAAHPLPPSGTDRYDADGVLYRFVTGHGFEFHPLGDFGALNTLILAGKTDQAKELADALVARGVPVDGRLLWSYPFPFGRGKPPWRSGMAQAVAAQALARTGQATADQDLLEAAGQAYAAIPGRLVRALPQGPWIKLYSFDAAPVLNAQLQTVISVGDYAQISGNTGAAGLAAQLQATAEALLPQFDTGFWSLYSLGGGEAPLSYHDYVVQLLRRLAARTGDTTWSDAATKFQSYETQAPVLKPSPAADRRSGRGADRHLSRPAGRLSRHGHVRLLAVEALDGDAARRRADAIRLARSRPAVGRLVAGPAGSRDVLPVADRRRRGREQHEDLAAPGRDQSGRHRRSSTRTWPASGRSSGARPTRGRPGCTSSSGSTAVRRGATAISATSRSRAVSSSPSRRERGRRRSSPATRVVAP